MKFPYTLRKLGHLLRKEAMKADTGRDSLATDHVKELKAAMDLLKMIEVEDPKSMTDYKLTVKIPKGTSVAIETKLI